MAARSPEPAKRWLLPQSARAEAAGRWRPSTSSRISAAALICAPGRMSSDEPAAQHMQEELQPHARQQHKSEREGRRAPAHAVGADVDGRMDEAGEHE